jgi:hypothetical protein
VRAVKHAEWARAAGVSGVGPLGRPPRGAHQEGPKTGQVIIDVTGAVRHHTATRRASGGEERCRSTLARGWCRSVGPSGRAASANCTQSATQSD